MPKRLWTGALALTLSGMSNLPVLAQSLNLPGASAESLIAQQIDQYNEAMRQEASAHGLKWINITPISRRNSVQSDWIATDGLHPGPSMYQAWVEKIRETIPQ